MEDFSDLRIVYNVGGADMKIRWAHSLRIVALFLLIAGAAEAQQIAGTFDQLRVLVKPGDTLTVTDANGKPVQGKVTQLSASSLVLDAAGGPLQFQEADVDMIEKRGPDSLKNGALIGLGIGAGLGAAVVAAVASTDGDEAGLAAFAALFYAGIGAGIGVGIDALIEGRRVIYASSKSTRPTVNVAPIFGRSRRGVLVSVRLSTGG